MNNCRICLSSDPHSQIQIFDDNGRTENIAAIVAKHLWFQLKPDDDVDAVLCQKCWLNLNNFHLFYNENELKHSCLITFANDVTKTTLDGTTKVEVKYEADTNDDAFENSDGGVFIKAHFSSDEDVKPDIDEMNADQIQEQTKRVRKIKTKPKSIKKRTLKQPKKFENPIPESLFKEHCNMSCDLCLNVPFKKWRDMNKHYNSCHDMKGYLVCCGRKFFKRSILMEHIAVHLNPNAFRCEKCGQTFGDSASLRKHSDSHIPADERPFKCDKCTKSYMKQYLLVSHLRWHIPKEEYKYECNECGKLFPTKTILSIHLRGVHEGAYVHVCEICAKVFKSKMFFLKHMDDVHTNTIRAKIQCQKCGKWLKHEESLRKHITRHTDSEKGQHVCNICGKPSPNRSALQSHKKYSHMIERSHKCSVCDKSFKKALTLKEHQTVHTGEVLYVCAYCPKTFNSSANMYAHRKKNHKAENEEAQKL